MPAAAARGTCVATGNGVAVNVAKGAAVASIRSMTWSTPSRRRA